MWWCYRDNYRLLIFGFRILYRITNRQPLVYHRRGFMQRAGKVKCFERCENSQRKEFVISRVAYCIVLWKTKWHLCNHAVWRSQLRLGKIRIDNSKYKSFILWYAVVDHFKKGRSSVTGYTNFVMYKFTRHTMQHLFPILRSHFVTRWLEKCFEIDIWEAEARGDQIQSKVTLQWELNLVGSVNSPISIRTTYFMSIECIL